MKTKAVDLSLQNPEIIHLSGNFNYGLECGKKETAEKAISFFSPFIDEEKRKEIIEQFKFWELYTCWLKKKQQITNKNLEY